MAHASFHLSPMALGCHHVMMSLRIQSSAWNEGLYLFTLKRKWMVTELASIKMFQMILLVNSVTVGFRFPANKYKKDVDL